MKKLILLLFILTAAPVLAQVNTNIVILTGGGDSAANATYYWNPTFLSYAIGGCTQLGAYTNASGGFISGYFGGHYQSDGSPCSAPGATYSSSSWPVSWTAGGGDPTPAPTGAFGYFVATNWIQTTSNLWSTVGDIVYLQAAGRDYSIPSATSNRLCVLLDTNIVFTGPWTSGAGLPWRMSGRIQWSGTTNLYYDAQMSSGDTNVGTFSASGGITNTVGANTWSWCVIGDTNGLTFDSASITAGRAPTNGLAQYVPMTPIVIASTRPVQVLTNLCIPTNCWPWTLPSGFCGFAASNYDLYWVTPLKTNLAALGH